MCSKKWANPDLPGSTSLRDPVCTGIWRETMLGKPVGTTMTFSPLARVFSVARKGRMSAAAGAELFDFLAAGLTGGVFWATAVTGTKARRIAARHEARLMKSPLSY